MKGYLERLVRTAASPAESVHPWTASVFAARYQDDLHDEASGESAPSASAMRPPDANADSEQAWQTSAPKQTSLSDVERKSPISGSQSAEVPSHGAGAQPSADRGQSPTRRMIPESFIANAVRSTRDAAETTEHELARAKAPEGDLAHRVYDPLVIKSGKVKMEPAASPLPSSAGKKEATAVRNSPAVDRQADEIQIHIGRIEVTAVQPPAPRAPTPREKEISLDAYLKRRAGRPG